MTTPIALFDCRPDAAVLEALAPVLASGQLAGGPNVAALEAAIARHVQRPDVVCLGDMTHALALALQLAGVGPGDDVLTLSYNCMSSNSAIAHVGATPVWVDIDGATATLSLADCERAITPRTRALVVYHVAGYPAPLAALRAFCDGHGIALVEDANNALGATLDGRPVGSVGDFAVFSFYANRQVNGVDGAALVCRDAATADEARRLRRFGIDLKTFRDARGEIDPASDIPVVGMSSPLNHVQATMALAHLGTLGARLARNRRNVETLSALLADLPAIRPVAWAPGAQPAFWAWLVRCDGRDGMIERLKARGVQCSKLHQPNHVYSGFGSTPRELPGTARFMDEMLALPCGWWLDDAALARLGDEIRTAAGAPGHDA
jgi:dTDP-4-amino-4,6-dideoxygalactose transaminase